MLKTLKSYIFIFTAAVMWGAMGVFVNNLSVRGVSSLELVFYRAAAAVICLFTWIAVKDRTLLKISLRDIWIFIGMGVVSFVFFNYCYITCIRQCSMSVAAALLYTAPVFVIIFSTVLFKEKLTFFKAAAIVVTVAGCFMVAGLFSQNGGMPVYGLILGVLSGLGYGLYSIFGRYGVERYNTLTVTAYTFLAAFAATIPFMKFSEIASHMSEPSTVAWSVLTGIVSCVLPYILYTAGLKDVPSGTASVIATVEPAVAAVISFTVYSEPISLSKAAGIVMILGAVAISALGENRKN